MYFYYWFISISISIIEITLAPSCVVRIHSRTRVDIRTKFCYFAGKGSLAIAWHPLNFKSIELAVSKPQSIWPQSSFFARAKRTLRPRKSSRTLTNFRAYSENERTEQLWCQMSKLTNNNVRIQKFSRGRNPRTPGRGGKGERLTPEEKGRTQHFRTGPPKT